MKDTKQDKADRLSKYVGEDLANALADKLPGDVVRKLDGAFYETQVQARRHFAKDLAKMKPKERGEEIRRMTAETFYLTVVVVEVRGDGPLVNLGIEQFETTQEHKSSHNINPDDVESIIKANGWEYVRPQHWHRPALYPGEKFRVMATLSDKPDGDHPFSRPMLEFSVRRKTEEASCTSS